MSTKTFLYKARWQQAGAPHARASVDFYAKTDEQAKAKAASIGAELGVDHVPMTLMRADHSFMGRPAMLEVSP